MNNDIDLWDGVAMDNRWDNDKNAKLLNIIFRGGTFGNFLKFFLDKFSKLTPNIHGDPFTDIGTSHKTKHTKFSNQIQAYHASFINDNLDETNLPICMILPSIEKHFYYLKKAQWYRPGDSKITPDFLWQKAIGELPDILVDRAQEIIKLYNIKETAHYSWIPKFIVRDWCKLDFLNGGKHSDFRCYDILKTHPFFTKQKVYEIDLEAFFDWRIFISHLKDMDKIFQLQLDFDRMSEMKDMYQTGQNLDTHRQECILVDNVLRNSVDRPLTGLDVSSEAYIYAYFEKQYPDIQMPLTNRFFRDYTEIMQFLEHFPNWYRRPNPNIG